MANKITSTTHSTTSAYGNRSIYSPAELALDLRSSWNHATDEVWRQLDPELWEITHNPWVVLQMVSRDRIAALRWPIRSFAKTWMAWCRPGGKRWRRLTWFQRNHSQSSLTCAAYFSMEFMLSEALPIYSGGLGNVAGDQLKAASDLGVPVVGVGLLVPARIFPPGDRQGRGATGALPVQRPRTVADHASAPGKRRVVAVGDRLPGTRCGCAPGRPQVGRAKLYLLDSNDAANFPAHRGHHQ